MKFIHTFQRPGGTILFEDLIGLLDAAAKDRIGIDEFPPHRMPLRTLTVEDECETGAFGSARRLDKWISQTLRQFINSSSANSCDPRMH